MRHLFELLPEQFELSDLVLNGGELLPDQREKSRPKRETRRIVQSARQCLQPLKRQSQRARPSDEAQPFHARGIVLSIARCGPAWGWQYPDLLVVANRFRRHSRRFRDLADRKGSRHDQPPSVETVANDKPSGDRKVKETAQAPPRPDRLRTIGPRQTSLLMSTVVYRLQVVHTQRTDTVLLNDRLLAGPAEMMNRRRHLENAASREHLPLPV